jgi:hypothetical protein
VFYEACCATRLKDKLTDKSEVIGYTKPSSNIESLVSTSNDISNMSKKNVLIFWGGTKAVIKKHLT